MMCSTSAGMGVAMATGEARSNKTGANVKKKQVVMRPFSKGGVNT